MNSKSGDKKLPGDLQDVASSLRDQRPTLEPLELDRIKLRAMSGARRKKSSGLGAGARSRATAFLTVAFLAVGTGGALALHGGKGVESGKHHSASFHQYRPCKTSLSGYGGKCVPVPPPIHCKGKLSGYRGKCVPVPQSGKGGKKGGKGGKSGKH